jgi:hypothetical protein
MRSIFLGITAAVFLCVNLTAPTAGRAAEGEDPHCDALQGQLLRETRAVTVLASAVRGTDAEIASDRRQIRVLEEDAVSQGKSRTGNVTSETRYYKDQIAELQREKPRQEHQLAAAQNRLAYIKGRQSVYNCNLSFDLSGEWTLTWTWSVTSVDFVGTVAGSGGHWTFTGTVEGGGNAIWTAKKGSGNVNCTLSGKVGGQGTIQCTASFGGPNPSTWTGEASGAIEPMSSRSKRNFEFSGRNGRGNTTGQPPAGIDELQLTPKD